MVKLEEAKNNTDKFVDETYGRFDVLIESGKGAVCTDESGKEYIDFGSGIGVNSLGYCNDGWCAAVEKQLRTLQHTSNLYYNKPYIELAEKICRATGLSSVFFGNSGAEANEGAIKAARKYSFDKYGENRAEIVSLKNSFHVAIVIRITMFPLYPMWVCLLLLIQWRWIWPVWIW